MPVDALAKLDKCTKTSSLPFNNFKPSFMHNGSVPTIENIIKDYIEHRDKSLYYGKKRIDAEKEYNKLLTKYDGEEKHYSLENANNIYKAYCDMIAFGEESVSAQNRFLESEEKLKEIGQILFEATITADIAMTPAINGGMPGTRTVRVTYNHGQVMVS